MLTALLRRSVDAVPGDHVVTSRRRRRSVALLSALAALANPALARAQDIRVVSVPLVIGAPIQFHRLPWPSTPVVVHRIVQDDYGFLWLAAADGLRRYDGHGLMRVPDGQSSTSIGFIIGQSLARDRSGRIWFGADDSLNLYDRGVSAAFARWCC
jgi:ligand-binding sensor domain-containing protein